MPLSKFAAEKFNMRTESDLQPHMSEVDLTSPWTMHEILVPPS